MRHTFATLSIAAGSKIEWISAPMGHENIAVTLSRYSKFLTPANEWNVAQIDAFYAASLQGQQRVSNDQKGE